MAWGKPAPEGNAPSWLMRIEKNDATLTSVHVLRVRPFDESLQIDTAKALEGNEHVREFYASGHRVTTRAARAWAECFAINISIASSGFSPFFNTASTDSCQAAKVALACDDARVPP